MTKLIRIFAFPSHGDEAVTGVDFVRIIQPMRYLAKEKGFKVTIWDREQFPKNMNWEAVAQNNDIIYFNYMSNPWGFAMLGMLARRYGGKLVMDLDDCLWRIKKDNPASFSYKKGQEGIKVITSICREVDFMTTTNNYLRNVIVENTAKTWDKIEVFPNYIDLDLYNHRCKFKDTSDVQIVHFGSTTHFDDLLNNEFVRGMSKIMNEYPNATFTTIGSFLPQFKERWGRRYVNCFGHPDVLKWIKGRYVEYMDKTDIFVAPLVEDIYTKSKSSIKYLEVSVAKIPGCWQNIRQYQEVVKNGKNGFLCESFRDWHRNIKKLIDDKVLRRKIGEEAFKTVEKDWQMKDFVKDYADFFRRVLE